MKKIMISLVAIATLMSSCTDAELGKMGGFGETYTVKVLGPDTVITYHSTGKVLSEKSSDGYYFTSKETGKLVEVSGAVIIEQE
jgi:hypothetical protein